MALAGETPGAPESLERLAADLLEHLKWRLAGVSIPDVEAGRIPGDLRRSILTAPDVGGLFSIPQLDLVIVSGGDPGLLDRVRGEAPQGVGVMDLAAVRRMIDNAKGEAARSPSLLNSLSDPVFILSPDGALQAANEAFLRLFPGCRAGLRGLTCHEVLYTRNEPCPWDDCPLKRTEADGFEPRHREYRLGEAGKVRHFEAAFSPIQDSEGEAGRFLVCMRDVTARKDLENELERSRSRYRHLFEHAKEGIVLFDASGDILETNMSLRHMLGYLQGELSTFGVSELARDESAKILANHLEDLQTLGSVTVDMVLVTRKGRDIPVEADVVWLRDEEVFLLMARDMTVRKRLEESRKLYSDKLKTEVEDRTRELRDAQQETVVQKQYAEGIIQGTPVPMLVLDRDHRITFWNKACEGLTGFSSREMIGTDLQWKPFYPEPRPTLADLIIEDDQEAIRRLYAPVGLRRLPLIQGAWEAEAFFPQIGDRGAHIYCTAAPIQDESGEIRGAIVTYQDVSDRVNMTREIERREAFVQNLVHNSIDGIIATNPEGTFVVFNRGAKRILGYEPEEVLGRFSYQDILSRMTARDVVKTFYSEQYGPSGKLINMESELLNREGEAIPVRLSGTLLFEEGREVGSVVFVQDLREIQRLQKEKESAERMAAIGKTVAGLAHYIKNVLNGLKGGGYVINSALGKGDLPLVAEGWTMVEKNIDQISDIVLDMLTYSTDRKPRLEAVDPNDLVSEVLDLLEDRARLSNVHLERELCPDLPPVAMDRTGIYRALLNLVSNAIDACTLEGIMESNGRVHVRVDRPPEGGVRFTVRDNGTGIDRETQKRLFSDFLTTKGYKGTGLGLPVTQKVVREHGGVIDFETEPGKGTTFTLRLPERRDERG